MKPRDIDTKIIARIKRELKESKHLLNEMTDSEPCQIDHNGFCQAHFCYPPCPHERAKKLLGKVTK